MESLGVAIIVAYWVWIFAKDSGKETDIERQQRLAYREWILHGSDENYDGPDFSGSDTQW